MFIKTRCKEQRSAAIILILLALSLQHFHNDLLFLDQESADNLLPHGLVAQDSTVSPEDGLLASGQTSLFLVPGNSETLNRDEQKMMLLLRGWLHSLQLHASHGTLGNRRALLEVLEDQLASRGPHLLDSVRLGVVRQPPSVGDPLHHLAALFFF